MKYNFNDSTIVTCYIKELLHSFNLPTLPIATDNTVFYTDRVYIKNNDISVYKDSKLNKLNVFMHNYPYSNITKTYTINSSTYDTETHEYLGNYLRFIRDYKKLDLMPLYNCFSNNQLVKIDKTINYSIEKSFDINSNDNYIYYSIPVKFNKKYTIAVSSPMRYELATVYYYNNGILDRSSELIDGYVVKSGTLFSNPFIYSTYFNSAQDPDFDDWRNEDSLRLIIKLHNSINSSIVVLEGDYVQSSNSVDSVLVSQYLGKDRFKTTKLSLLEIDNKKSYPFADRLIEYLMSNVISPLDDISSNIRMVQKFIYDNYLKGIYGVWDENIENKLYQITRENNILSGDAEILSNELIRSELIKNGDTYEESEVGDPVRIARRYIDSYSDTLYYVDKDLEQVICVR